MLRRLCSISTLPIKKIKNGSDWNLYHVSKCNFHHHVKHHVWQIAVCEAQYVFIPDLIASYGCVGGINLMSSVNWELKNGSGSLMKGGGQKRHRRGCLMCYQNVHF